MKTVEVRHGCYAAEVCGALDHHTCGSPDACNVVRPNGVVCTFGTTTRTVFHELADIAAEVQDTEIQHEKAHGRKPDAAEKAAIHVAVARNKNILTPAAEAEAKQFGHRHHTDNRTLHDTHPEVFHG